MQILESYFFWSPLFSNLIKYTFPCSESVW